MKPAKVTLDGQYIGTIEDIGYDYPYLYGRWVPADPETDARIRALAEGDESALPMVAVEGEPADRWFLSSIDDDEINLRTKMPQSE